MDREHQAQKHYYDPTFKCEAVKLFPGEYYVSVGDDVLVTVLGSCVSACIWDKKTGIGGMNHFMLPTNSNCDSTGRSARYGGYAMEVLINHIIQLGGQRHNLLCKVFGGGNMSRFFTDFDVGKSNAEFVLNYLHAENIPVLAEDLLDTYPRKVYFFPSSGRVMVRRLKNMHNDTIEKREQSYFKQVNQEEIEGDYDLFS